MQDRLEAMMGEPAGAHVVCRYCGYNAPVVRDIVPRAALCDPKVGRLCMIDPTVYYVKCSLCGGCGPWHATERRAIDAYNAVGSARYSEYFTGLYGGGGFIRPPRPEPINAQWEHILQGVADRAGVALTEIYVEPLTCVRDDRGMYTTTLTIRVAEPPAVDGGG